MQHVGLLTPLEEVEGDAELVAATRAALEEGVHQLADTVRNSLNFYRMQERRRERRARPADRAPCSPSPASPTSSRSSSSCRVEPAFVVVDGDEEADPARLAVAAGLAIEDRI